MKIKFNIHPLYYIIAFICFITGHFKGYIIYTLIILVHEFGHIFAGLILKWPILKVTIYPFGCMTTFNNKLNSSSIEEFLILIYGPLFQILFNMIYPTNYHYFILIFNLLPIYPLDGSKLLFLLLNKIISYYYSYVYIFIISYVTIILLLINRFNFINLIILLYIAYDVYRYSRLLPNIMYKFYYERYKYKYKYKYDNIIIGNNRYKMCKEKNNYFIIDNICYNEYNILKQFFERGSIYEIENKF